MINYAGIDLNLEDAQGNVRDFLNRYLELEATRLFGGMPPGQTGFRLKSRSNEVPSGTGLPLPNYLPAPKPCINRLYWPSGATRWSYIVIPLRLDQVLQLTEIGFDQDGNNPLPFIMSDTNTPAGKERKIECSMYMLPPRPVSIPQYEDGLWLLPLVDDRYYWQFRTPANLLLSQQGDNFNSWDSLLNVIADSLCIDLTWDKIAAAYGSPNATEFSRSYESGAALLDAVAYSVGQRVVFDPVDSIPEDFARDTSTSTTSTPGQNITPSPVTCRNQRSSARLINWDSSEEIYDENFEQLWYQIGGGDFSDQVTSAVYPEKVVVTFPKYEVHNDGSQTALPTGELFGVIPDNSAAIPPYFDPVISPTLGMTSVMHSSARALIFETGMINQNNLNELADQIARDYYASLNRRYDFAFASMLDWSMTGYDDFMEFSHERMSNGEYTCRTRIQTFPYNHGVTEALQQINADQTTSSTTFTTLAPCLGTCHYVATSDGLGWTQTSSECSGIQGCECIPPQWCPVDGTCSTATTNCGSGSLPGPPACGNTTTTSTSSTSSTSSTTCSPFTPLPPGPCDVKCDWKSITSGSDFTWVLLTPMEQQCDPPQCNCCFPQIIPTDACQLTQTPCCWAPTTTTPQPSCGSICEYIWSINSVGNFLWSIASNGCFSDPLTSDCSCDPPGFPGSACEQKVYTQCYFHTTSTTTLQPTTTLGPGYCTTTTAAATTPYPTTSTTPAPDACGQCVTRWNGTSWDVAVNNCGSCTCVKPNDSGTTCETRLQPCVPSTTTTSTTTTTTTTTACVHLTPCCTIPLDCSMSAGITINGTFVQFNKNLVFDPGSGKWIGNSLTGITCNGIQQQVILNLYCAGSDSSSLLLDISVGGCNVFTGLPPTFCQTTGSAGPMPGCCNGTTNGPALSQLHWTGSFDGGTSCCSEGFVISGILVDMYHY